MQSRQASMVIKSDYSTINKIDERYGILAILISSHINLAHWGD